MLASEDIAEFAVGLAKEDELKELYGDWKNVNDYFTEVIQHLMAVVGADVDLTLEVSVNAPDGIPSATVRTVSENCRTLKIQNFGFEDN